ncbi:MAG: CoA transferase [Actinobacteria bacterium]|nr:MAG: CoA transferase [Actinomycetota bacterium]
MDPAALDGVLVADFSRVLAGPYATMLLADLGATVVKVERPGSGDDTRAWGPPYAPDGQSTYFHSVNRNKRSIALDLTDPDDLAVAQHLARTCDVLVQNYKPGGLRRFGLDHTSVAEVNPGVVYCSISGFGSGEGRDLPGYDLLVQAMGGLMSITGDEEPTKAGVAVVDVLTGLHATVAVLAALRHRDLTGSGQHVEVSLLSALLSSLVNQSSAFVGAGEVPQRLGNAHPSIAPYDLFATADRPMIIAVGNDAQFRRLAEVLQRRDLADNPDYRTNSDRVAHRDSLKADLEQVLHMRGADHWQSVLTESGIPCGPINTIDQAFGLAARLGLDPVVDAGGMPVVANPVHYAGTPPQYRSAPPRVDGDRAEVLALLRERA